MVAAYITRASVWEAPTPLWRRVWRIPLKEHRMSRQWRWMHLVVPFMMVRRVTSSHAWLSSDDMFSLPPLSFSSTLKNVLLLQKIKRVCYLLSLSYLVLFLLVVSNYIYFFNCMLWHLIFISNLSSYFIMFQVWPSMFRFFSLLWNFNLFSISSLDLWSYF